MTSAAAGLQSLATFISLDPAVVDESLDYCMKRTGKRWGDYMGVLGKVADRKVGSVYGGCNLVHLIANALNIEKGITAGEFEECLGLPEGFIGRFPYPRAKVGKLVSGICWLVQAMRPFFYSTCLWSFLFLGWGEFGWVIHRVTFFTVFQEFQFCSISLRMVALLFAKRSSPPPLCKHRSTRALDTNLRTRILTKTICFSGIGPRCRISYREFGWGRR
jgi:hypothetical protein